jgi:spermidine synthase
MQQPSGSGATPTFRLEIFLVSLAAIVFEISMTRVFSFKLYHYFTYFILGVAMLGLGAGGVFTAILPGLKRRDPARQVPLFCLLAGLAVPSSYAAVAFVQLNVLSFTQEPAEIAKLALVCFFLFLPFLLVGIVLATIFGSRAADMSRLYFADLAGAGLGCALAIPLFSTITPPGAALASGLVLALAAVVGGRSVGRVLQVASLALALLIGASLLQPDRIPQPIPDSLKTLSPQRLKGRKILFTGWSSVFRVDVVGEGRRSRFHTLHHDGNIGSAVHRWDGTTETTARFDRIIRKKPFAVLPPDPKVLIIGAAGGNEIMGSLHYGASSVTAVELNPVTISLLTDHFEEFTGGVANDPRVTLINAEGRSFIEQTDETFDLIWLVAPDSYAAMNAASSGAFVLTESYLYTVEMVERALERLRPGGVLCNQFGELFLYSQPTRTPRFIATAMEALQATGVEDPRRHLLVSHGRGFLPGSTVLVGRDPFTPEQIQRYRESVATLPKAGLWHPNDEKLVHPVTEMLSRSPDSLPGWYDEYPFDVTPVRDDSPFFWHFTSFSRALFGGFEGEVAKRQFEVATGERILVFLLLFGVAFAGVFILLPLFAIRDVWHEMPSKSLSAVYFSALGLGFMWIEVCLIQKLTLFLGYPSYTLTVTLFSLLLSSGLGSLLSERLLDRRNRSLGMLMAALAVLTLVAQFGLDPLTGLFVQASFPLRVAITVLMLLPVGLVLGAFMPMGIATISGISVHQKEYVAWAWSINGFFSVVGSVSSTILSMTLGFRWVLLLAFLVYGLGILALTRIPSPRAPGLAEPAPGSALIDG